MLPRNRKRLPTATVLVTGWLAMSCAAVPVQGQQAQARIAVAASGVAGPQTSLQNVFQRPKRDVLQQLGRARELLARQRYSEAVRCLGAILEEDEDFFFQPDKDNLLVHRSLKAEALRLIGQMPAKARELYELHYGGDARELLRRSLEQGNAAGLAEVARRFFHTTAGYEATLLLGLRYLDRDQPLAGALMLRRLERTRPEADRFEPTLSLALAVCWMRAGMHDEAEAALTALRERRGGKPIRLGGREVPWFRAETEASDWLAALVGPVPGRGPRQAEHWVMFRGSPGRNATSRGGAPLLNERWRIPATDDPLVENLLRQVGDGAREQGLPMLPSVHPVVVHRPFDLPRPGREPWKIGDVLLMRTLTNLLAVDLRSGKRLWEVPVDDPLESLVDSPGDAASEASTPQRAAGLAVRLWGDATFGTISSDGRLVFSVEDTPSMTSLQQSARNVLRIGGRNQNGAARPPLNRLAAHDIRTGKLKWHLGGPSDRFALRQAETFFLGAPLPLMGKAYVLAEKSGEIRLLALDAATGDLQWAQQLAVIEDEFGQERIRRTVGVSPSYADGILVCPTATGAVVAVDLATRSLLWGYQYQRQEDLLGSRAQILRMRSGRLQPQNPYEHWSDASVTLADGRALLTPPGSDELHCLDLLTGKPLWRAPRNDELYVACVHQGTVVLVGRRQVRALSLHEASEQVETVNRQEMNTQGTVEMKTEEVRVMRPRDAWGGRTVELPEGAAPSGRGFFNGQLYYIPLTTAEIVALDVGQGSLAGRVKSRKGIVPGNLVCYDGRIISQGFLGVDAFYQLEVAREEIERRLADDASDSVALALRGEILLDEGRLDEAIALFRKAYASDADPRTRVMLRDALLEGLATQFVSHRDQVTELEPLLDSPKQRAEFLRLMAVGLRGQGEWKPALEGYLELIDLQSDNTELDEVAPGLSVQRDRWIRAQLAALSREAGDEASEVLGEPLQTRLESVLAAEDTQPLERFLTLFGDQPQAAQARRALLARWRAEGLLLKAELDLLHTASLAEAATAGPALAELADLFAAAGRFREAASSYQQLGARFADVLCRDNKTGAEVLENAGRQEPVAEALAGPLPWPSGRVDVELSPPGRVDGHGYGRHGLPLRQADDLFGDLSIQLDQHRRVIRAIDSNGQPVWEMAVPANGPQRGLSFNRALSQSRTCGHLLLVGLGSQGNLLMAIDTLAGGDPSKPQLLWTKDLHDPGLDLLQYQQLAGQPGMPFAPLNVPFRRVSSSSMQSTAGGLGPVSNGYVCFQQFRKLVAVDPVSGQDLWVRHHLAPASILFGDDEYVFALAPDKTEAEVFRALDGELLGKRKIPRGQAAAPAEASAEDGAAVPPFAENCLAQFGRRLLLWQPDGDMRSLQLYDPWTEKGLWPLRRFPVDTRYAVVGHEALALFEPSGRFRLIALPDGRALADLVLEVNNVSEIFAFRCGQQYILVAHTPAAERREAVMPIQAVPGMRFQPITRGQVYSFDLEGNSLWPEPVTIENQHLLPDQPSQLPVVTFACQLYDRNQQGVNRRQLSLLCLDKQTGREVYKNRWPGSTSIFEITGHPDQHTVELKTAQRLIRLKFTDEPVEPLPPAASLLKAFRRGLRQTLEEGTGAESGVPQAGETEKDDSP